MNKKDWVCPKELPPGRGTEAEDKDVNRIIANSDKCY